MPISIFRRMDVFDDTYVPDLYLHREREMEELAACVAPLLQGLPGNNAVLYGNPATGKTTSVKKLFEHIEDSGARAACVYVNAALRPSAWAVLSEMARAMGQQVSLPDKSTGVVRLVDVILRRLSREGTPLALCIDEFTCMRPQDLDAVIAPFLRPWEFSPLYDGVKTSVFLVASSFRPENLRCAVLSSLSPVRVEFAPYTADHIYAILESRANAGFGEGVVTREALRAISESGLDLRQCIRALRTAGGIADREGGGEVTAEHAREVLVRQDTQRPEDGLSVDERTIFDEIGSRGEMGSGEIYAFSKGTLGLGQTRTYHILAKLLEGGLLEADYCTDRGRSRVFRRASR